MQLLEHLAAVPLFNGLTAEQFEALAMIVTDQEFGRGRIIFHEGDEGVGFYVVLSGRVKIYKVSPEGKEQILHIPGPGETFAEVAVFAGTRFPATAMTLEKSRILFCPKESFVTLIRDNPALAMNLLASLSMRLRRFASMVENLSLKEVPGRLAAYILVLSERQNNRNKVTLDITKVQLAGLLGTIPETLSRILTRMGGNGLIEVNGPAIAILDREELKALAAGEVRLDSLPA